MTGNDLGYKPEVIEKAKFECSPLGKVFNKGLDESNKKQGLLKRLKNIESKNGEQLKANGGQAEKQIKVISQNKIKVPLLKSVYNRALQEGNIDSNEAITVFKALQDLEGKKTDYRKFVYKSDDNVYFDFGKYGLLSSF